MEIFNSNRKRTQLFGCTRFKKAGRKDARLKKILIKTIMDPLYCGLCFLNS